MIEELSFHASNPTEVNEGVEWARMIGQAIFPAQTRGLWSF